MYGTIIIGDSVAIKILDGLRKFPRTRLIREIHGGHGYSILISSKSLKEDDFINRISLQSDNYGYVSQELGEELDTLIMDDNYALGIHRTGYTHVDEEVIEDVFNIGLINNGDAMQGVVYDYIDIEKTVSLYSEITIMLDNLKKSHGYKGSQGCFIVRIPKPYLGKKPGEIKPIYYKYNGTIRLLPEFIYGYVPVDKDGKLGDIVRNPSYKDIHELDNENLLYDASACYMARNLGINLEKQKKSINDKYQIIANAYKDTLVKYGNYQAEQALLYLINNNETQYFTGKENRENLKKYIIYDDILKILSFSLQNSKDATVNDIISNFMNCVKEELENKFVVK